MSDPLLLQKEITCWRAGFRRVAGVDEVGRGPLAGPVVAAAVVLDPDRARDWWAQVRDSKTLTARQRERLAEAIRRDAEYGIGSVSWEKIDEINILQATKLAMRLALDALPVAADFVLVDGLVLEGTSLPQEPVVCGDACCPSVAAASIVAKVARDALMAELDGTYPGYGFARNKGYGTADHLAALAALGPCAIHRRSFAPVRACLECDAP